MSYHTVAQPAEHVEGVKGSRFVAFVTPVASVEQAMTGLASVRTRSPNATHHCWAYRFGRDYRFSDDGEPGAAAGRPMLALLARRDLDHVLAVVTRYYGGTKLGVGGLARAYGVSLARALEGAGVREVHPRVSLRVAVPFADMDALHRLLGAWDGLEKGEMRYDAAGLSLTVNLFETDQEAFATDLTELTRGAVRLEPQDS